MNRMTRQYLEQSNRCMNNGTQNNGQQMKSGGNSHNFTPPRFEPVGQNKPTMPNMPTVPNVPPMQKNTYRNTEQNGQQCRPAPPPPPQAECEEKPQPRCEKSSDPIKNILGGDINSDSLLIIMLIAILAKEKADIKLLLALGYLLL